MKKFQGFYLMGVMVFAPALALAGPVLGMLNDGDPVPSAEQTQDGRAVWGERFSEFEEMPPESKNFILSVSFQEGFAQAQSFYDLPRGVREKLIQRYGSVIVQMSLNFIFNYEFLAGFKKDRYLALLQREQKYLRSQLPRLEELQLKDQRAQLAAQGRNLRPAHQVFYDRDTRRTAYHGGTLLFLRDFFAGKTQGISFQPVDKLDREPRYGIWVSPVNSLSAARAFFYAHRSFVRSFDYPVYLRFSIPERSLDAVPNSGVEGDGYEAGLSAACKDEAKDFKLVVLEFNKEIEADHPKELVEKIDSFLASLQSGSLTADREYLNSQGGSWLSFE